MHIVFLTHEYPVEGNHHGGVGSFVHFLAHRLTAKGHRVSVAGIYRQKKDEIRKDGEITIYRIAARNWKALNFIPNTQHLLKTLREIHARNPIDIVEGPELSFAFFPKHTPYKKVIRLHGGHHFFSLELGKSPKFWRSFQEKQSFQKADAYVAVSDYVGRKTQEYLGYPFPYEVIYNAIDPESFSLPGDINPEPDSLLFYGTICEKKGIRQLVMAMPEILREVPTARLNVVGRDWTFPDGRSYREYLQTFIDEKTAGHIRFHGPVPREKIKSFLARNQVVVLPSHMEAMPLAWIEALVSGKPFVGGDIGPGREIVRHGETGLLADPKNPKDIAEKVIRMLRNKEEARQMGLAARRHLLQMLDPEKITEHNLAFYRQVFGGKGK